MKNMIKQHPKKKKKNKMNDNKNSIFQLYLLNILCLIIKF